MCSSAAHAVTDLDHHGPLAFGEGVGAGERVLLVAVPAVEVDGQRQAVGDARRTSGRVQSCIVTRRWVASASAGSKPGRPG